MTSSSPAAETLVQNRTLDPTEWTLKDVDALTAFLHEQIMEQIATFSQITLLGIEQVSIILNDEGDYNIETCCFPLEPEDQK
jgi:hypothetical protein